MYCNLRGRCSVGWRLFIQFNPDKKQKRVVAASLGNGHHVYVQYGDIFDEQEVLDPKKRRNIVIPVNRCFDTRVDDDLISGASLHGIALKRLFKSKKIKPDDLSAELQQNLLQQKHVPYELSSAEKPKGNTLRYPVGAVAEYKVSTHCTYFFLGLTTLDDRLSASVSDEDYVLALIRLVLFL